MSSCCASWSSSWRNDSWSSTSRVAAAPATTRRAQSEPTAANGYRDRAWETRAGAVQLKIPKLRRGNYFPELLDPRRTAEKALTTAILDDEGTPVGISLAHDHIERPSDWRLTQTRASNKADAVSSLAGTAAYCAPRPSCHIHHPERLVNSCAIHPSVIDR